ncbi:Z1 domain-containing protein [Antarcticirhabdus aurantiaca]|uniref:Z1 domain-containing protein n=1 Tax=Antarcticirhabdus aurantiaca TaxID=2606717 RepID=A0ACD4NP21_9HYPH|nr:Z1 domain-containing protein [Antarcticirhabdus aurantiaca]WAJ28504.1 Z1 domain-containing protein [Jeongeuplla avenae]
MFEQLNGALALMQSGPKPLGPALAASAAVNDVASPLDALGLEELLSSAAPGDASVGIFRRALAIWDNEGEAIWTRTTLRNTAERRARIYEALLMAPSLRELCNERFPFHRLDAPSVIAADHERWYDEARRRSSDFYWTAYRRQLERQGWSEAGISALDESTTSVIERLSDPRRTQAYQAKGLVVGYVQSGKTANFTGVISKAADAGYKLIIVLAGTLDVLRSQTQRRIDKDLIGRELLDRDYVHDADWKRFLEHGAKPSSLGSFDWHRLTGPESDYRKLGRAVHSLAFVRSNTAKPFFDPDNLVDSPARIAIVKKNSKILERLLSDLRFLGRTRTGAPLDQIPTLIVDDESDQASINSNKPVTGPEEQERTATNRGIVELLRLLPRAQYVGYTATPFANVFVDPNNEEDIFPRDFLVSLPRPDGYMGVADFYDLNGSSSDESTRPNRRDYMRPLVGDDTAAENLPRALDSYVLSGALKLFREAARPDLTYRHHTMLAHASARVAEHDDLAESIRAVLQGAGYEAGRGPDRLAKLLETDFRPVSAIRSPDMPFPATFEEIAPFVGETLARLGEAREAVRILNNENQDQAPDFDKNPVWKILVGGTKLSRGYTVEGLTVSYYRRRAQTADTLMQMGRWFGFRHGYRDLVRLFIGTDEWLDRNGRRRIDLYEAFGAVCRDEELFREELKRYASMEEPRITPIQIPPLVPMHMLKPTAANKMYNARVTYRNFGGQLAESTFAPTDPKDVRSNQDLVEDIIGRTTVREMTLVGDAARGSGGLTVNAGILRPSDIVELIRGYIWFDRRERGRTPNPLYQQLEFLQQTGDRSPQIEDWVFMSPKFDSPRAHLSIAGADFHAVFRSRNGPRFTTYNDPVHRRFAEHVTGKIEMSRPNAALDELRRPGRGAMLFYPITDVKTGKVKPPFSPGLTFLFPKNTIRTPLTFGVVRPDRPSAAVVPAE